MQVREYIFRSPYPSRIQVGTPDIGSQTLNRASKEVTSTQKQQIQTDVSQSQAKAITGGKKLTPEINTLDIYA